MGRPFWANLIGEFPYEKQSWGCFHFIFGKVANFEKGLHFYQVYKIMGLGPILL